MKKREEYYQIKTACDSKEGDVIALVCDYNPGLPNVGRILGQHKHILNLDDKLVKIIKPDSIVASYRGARTIQDKLIHSKLHTKEDVNVPPGIEAPQLENVNTVHEGGCHECEKKCVLCKNYLRTTTTITSYHTNSVFPIVDNVDCNTKCIIYLINDLICKRSYTGCTTDSAKTRFANHKSHIKFGRNNCLVSKHFADNENWHPLDRSTFANFDKCLNEQIEITIIENVKIPCNITDTYDRLSYCEDREKFWRDRLRTLEDYGGLNTRELKKKNTKSRN